VRLSPFRLHRPATVQEAVGLLRDLGPGALPYCGGTELLLVAKLGLTDFTDLIDLKGITELRGIEGDGISELRGIEGDGISEQRAIEASGSLSIGAATTHREIERSSVVRGGWPSMAFMESRVGNVRVRNVGTIGGNLCFADPHSDPATFLIAAGGFLVARGVGDARQIPVQEFTRGPYETMLAREELLVRVVVPPLPNGSALVHRKMAFHERPAITVAIFVDVRDGAVAQARVAVGSVGVAPARLTATEESLRGSDALAPALSDVAETAATEAEPVEDANGSVQYKRQLVRVLVARCAGEAVAAARGA
jgi:aerobic carbon-monoxide dehydrogenase medium subunit